MSVYTCLYVCVCMSEQDSIGEFPVPTHVNHLSQ